MQRYSLLGKLHFVEHFDSFDTIILDNTNYFLNHFQGIIKRRVTHIELISLLDSSNAHLICQEKAYNSFYYYIYKFQVHDGN